ncbi:MAG: NAD(P)/FAD-dependent oxidoreductase [Lachnoclostridium sp.]|nr:NAD(P)/FAD-dependent oxidoreductase [Lachnoclostridium sp.]
MNVSADSRKRIVVIGGGFAGLNFINKLDDKKFDIVLVDKNNYNSFPPLFYQVASSGVEPSSIAFPFRKELRHRCIHKAAFHLGEAREIDAAAKTVKTQYETIHYDILVVAAGTKNNFYGNPSLVDSVFTLKSIDEAIRIRNEVLQRCERASIEPDATRRRQMLSFVVIGGGPAGVEVAGALGELKRYIVARDYPSISPDEITITILEGTDRLLRTMSEKSSEDALKGLTDLMVDIKLNSLMKSYTDNVVTLADSSTIYSEMVIWTAGVEGAGINILNADLEKASGGRIAVDDQCRVTGAEDIFAIGDIGYNSSEKYPRGLPQLAQVAIQQGRYVARGLNRGDFKGAFEYRDKGSMATIGRNRAVADIGKIHFSGWLAWMAWMFIHLLSLMGMRNRVSVLLNWMWAYFTYNTSLRLLFKGTRYPLRD